MEPHLQSFCNFIRIYICFDIFCRLFAYNVLFEVILFLFGGNHTICIQSLLDTLIIVHSLPVVHLSCLAEISFICSLLSCGQLTPISFLYLFFEGTYSVLNILTLWLCFLDLTMRTSFNFSLNQPYMYIFFDWLVLLLSFCPLSPNEIRLWLKMFCCTVAPYCKSLVSAVRLQVELSSLLIRRYRFSSV